MTPTQIETAARRMLNAVGSSFWSSEEIIEDYLYMAALELAQETFCIDNRYTTVSVADQEEYASPSRMIAVKYVSYDGQKLRPLSKLQRDSIDLNTTTTVTGVPLYYEWWDSSLILFPTPAEADKTILIRSFDQPSQPTATSTLEIPSAFHVYLVLGVAYYMSLKELGHPHVQRFEYQWNHPGNPNNAINKVRRAIRMRNKDQFATVIREEDQPSTLLGMS